MEETGGRRRMSRSNISMICLGRELMVIGTQSEIIYQTSGIEVIKRK
jgi:hypothetical protein